MIHENGSQPVRQQSVLLVGNVVSVVDHVVSGVDHVVSVVGHVVSVVDHVVSWQIFYCPLILRISMSNISVAFGLIPHAGNPCAPYPL